ncbi:MAG: DUF1634 domain-containing protein [Sphingobacteriales bacterium]|nr:DUF1634 domain-containing protein [Sphingobacteriales bacterium]
MKQDKLTDKNLEVMMGTLLRYGVLLSAFIVMIGGILYLIKFGNQQPHYTHFSGEPANLINLKSILNDAKGFHSRAIIQLGLLVLIATPIARIILSVVGFILEKDYLYVLITLIVLTVILFSLFSGSVA